MSVGLCRFSVLQPNLPSTSITLADRGSQPVRRAPSGNGREGPGRFVALPTQHDDPGDPRELVGVCHGRHVHRASLQQTVSPAGRAVSCPLTPADYRSRTMDQQAADVAVTPLADASKSLFATTRPLLRHKLQPSRKLSSGAKLTWVTHRRHQSTGRDRANTRHTLQTATGFIRSMPGKQPGLDLVDALAKSPELRGKNAEHFGR